MGTPFRRHPGLPHEAARNVRTPRLQVRCDQAGGSCHVAMIPPTSAHPEAAVVRMVTGNAG
jgi:hypothetical protein